jgi:hypothetical protein
MLLNPTFDINRLLAWVSNRRADLVRQIEMLESGEMRTSSYILGEPQRDTTAVSLAEAKRKLRELDVLWADMEPAEFPSQVGT